MINSSCSCDENWIVVKQNKIQTDMVGVTGPYYLPKEDMVGVTGPYYLPKEASLIGVHS